MGTYRRAARSVAAVLCLACLWRPAVARADTGLSIVDPAPGYAGATVDVAGCGFQASETVDLALDGGPSAQSDADGAGCARWSVATDPTIKPTLHMWSASGEQSGTAEMAPYVVSPPMVVAVPPALPTAGGALTLQGTYFAPGEEVDLISSDGHLVSPGTAFAGPNGDFVSVPFTLLPDSPPGTYVVTLRGHSSSTLTTVQVLVIPPATPAADGRWTLDGVGTMDEPKSGTHTTVTLNATITASGGQLTGDGQYAGEVALASMTCTSDPVPISLTGTATDGKLSITSGSSAPGATMTVHCPGIPAMSFPMPGGAGSGPPIELEARDGATADQDNPDAGGPVAHWHYTLHASS